MLVEYFIAPFMILLLLLLLVLTFEPSHRIFSVVSSPGSLPGQPRRNLLSVKSNFHQHQPQAGRRLINSVLAFIHPWHLTPSLCWSIWGTSEVNGSPVAMKCGCEFMFERGIQTLYIQPVKLSVYWKWEGNEDRESNKDRLCPYSCFHYTHSPSVQPLTVMRSLKRINV